MCRESRLILRIFPADGFAVHDLQTLYYVVRNVQRVRIHIFSLLEKRLLEVVWPAMMEPFACGSLNTNHLFLM